MSESDAEQALSQKREHLLLQEEQEISVPDGIEVSNSTILTLALVQVLGPASRKIDVMGNLHQPWWADQSSTVLLEGVNSECLSSGRVSRGKATPRSFRQRGATGSCWVDPDTNSRPG